MTLKDEITAALNKMILSASGWRGIFAVSGDEEGAEAEISAAHRIISGAAAMIFAEYFQKKAMILVGCDTRPTGKAITEAVIPVLLACGCEVRYAGYAAAPEIMAWARKAGGNNTGFIYISASHNPIGHNGLKFGLTDGGVLAAEETAKLITNFRNFFERNDCIEKIENLISAADPGQIKKVYDGISSAKAEAVKAYYDFCGDVVWGGNSAISAEVRDGLEKQPLGLVCDFNGSARTVSIDRDFFSSIGLKFECINGEPGRIAHRIVPEGESLQPCRLLLEKAHERDASFVLGYVPDCDGDRGNLVIWDDTQKKAHALEAQEVFALACVAELSHLVWTGELAYDGNGNPLVKAAVAANDPTSMRIDRIAEAFGVSVFRAEVGEANVVGLARKLRKEGYIVRILGEGSAGGNITHPSAVRDPINTVIALVKLLSVRSTAGKIGFKNMGLFELWCKFSGQSEKYRENFTFADIIASLPQFTTTPAYSQDAVLRINTNDHALLKDRYQQIFLREWEKRKDELKADFGFCEWEAVAYNGLTEKRGINRFGEAGKGGLKISFLNAEGRVAAYIWMRGSATEPVFRIMADVEGSQGGQIERDLLNWHRRIIIEADELAIN
ncbi:MAG: phosphatidylglycerol lysyltransferase [Treponema sp.]|jgi:phosphoglucomutase|nr:phosphatidylglycerol lysyltransferase [Treponema sp.]